MDLTNDELQLLIDAFCMRLQRKNAQGEAVTEVEKELYFKLMEHVLIPQQSVQS